MQAKDNIFLVVKPGVVLTPVIEPVIVALEKYFAMANHYAFVTSGLRDAHDQLRIVKTYIKAKGLEKLYPQAIACMHPTEKDGKYYRWQLAWSHLLSIGVIINPPLAAECLMDYYGATGKGTNRKGKVINQTPHATGLCFDIGGKGGELTSIKDEIPIVAKAFKEGIKGMVNYLPEHANNAIHIDCKIIK